MEELARRLVQGVGVPKDQQAGAGWLLRAAQRGSAQSAFNVGVMYERGFVVERDSTTAVEWYRKAVDANLPMAKHNLALLLRDGKGARAQRQGGGRAAALGERARAWPPRCSPWATSTSAATPCRRIRRWRLPGSPSPPSSSARPTAAARARSPRRRAQRAQALQRILLPGELERAQQIGQSEFKQIVEALQPPKPAARAADLPPPPPAPLPPHAPCRRRPARRRPPDADPPGWPKAANDQVRVIQQALVDLKFLRDKPDGAIGPMTRAAIRAFQRSAGAARDRRADRDVFVSRCSRRSRAAMPAAPRRTAAEPAAVGSRDIGRARQRRRRADVEAEPRVGTATKAEPHQMLAAPAAGRRLLGAGRAAQARHPRLPARRPTRRARPAIAAAQAAAAASTAGHRQPTRARTAPSAHRRAIPTRPGADRDADCICRRPKRRAGHGRRPLSAIGGLRAAIARTHAVRWSQSPAAHAPLPQWACARLARRSAERPCQPMPASPATRPARQCRHGAAGVAQPRRRGWTIVMRAKQVAPLPLMAA